MKNELTDFKEFLLNPMRVKENIIPYYLKRINSALVFNKRTFGQQIANSEKDEFLKSLSKKCEEWQINQADYSIRHKGHKGVRPEKKATKQVRSRCVPTTTA